MRCRFLSGDVHCRATFCKWPLFLKRVSRGIRNTFLQGRNINYENMAKYAVIKQNYEFRRAYRRGKNYVSSCLVVYCFKKKYGGIRIGITSGKKIGKAVKRNRARRIIREAFRSIYPQIQGNWDIIFVARTATTYKKSTDIAVVMKKQLKEAGVLN